MDEVFNLERVEALKQLIDPTGKKWELHGQRGSSLVHARPNPDRSDAQIPKAFSGQWTSPAVLIEKITVWLNQQWDKSDEIKRVAALKAQRTALTPIPEEELEPVVKQTPEESLAALDPKIAAELGDILAVEDEDAQTETEEENEKAREGANQAQADNHQEQAGGSEDTGSKDASSEKEGVVEKEDLTTLKMDELRAIATPLGVKGTSKSGMIAAIEVARRQAG